MGIKEEGKTEENMLLSQCLPSANSIFQSAFIKLINFISVTKLRIITVITELMSNVWLSF